MKKITTRLPLLILTILCLNTYSFAQPAFILSDIDVCENSTVEVDVTIADFTLITSFQYSINWDPTVIQIIDVVNINEAISDNVFLGNFNAESNVLSISWFDNSVAGVTVADDEVLFSISYTITGDNSALSMVTFGDVPTVREVSAVVDSEITIVEADYTSGMVMVAQPELGSVNVTDDVNMSGVGAIDVTISNGTAPYDFVWETGQTTEDISNLSVGDYSATVTDAKGCASDIGPFTVGNIVGTKELKGLIGVQVFPNPTADKLNFIAELEQSQALELTIFNILGEKVYFENQESANIDQELDLSHLANGTYFLQLSSGDGAYVQRIQVQR